MYAAAFLRERGHHVKLIESSVKQLTHKKTVKILRQDPPDYVLIPSTLLSMEDDKFLARSIKKYLPETKIIFSGPLVTYNPSIVVSNSIITCRAGFTNRCDTTMVNVLVIEY